MTKQVIRRAGKHLKVCSLASACSDSRVTPIMIMSDAFIPSLQGLPGSMLLRQASAYLILPSYEIPSCTLTKLDRIKALGSGFQTRCCRLLLSQTIRTR